MEPSKDFWVGKTEYSHSTSPARPVVALAIQQQSGSIVGTLGGAFSAGPLTELSRDFIRRRFTASPLMFHNELAAADEKQNPAPHPSTQEESLSNAYSVFKMDNETAPKLKLPLGVYRFKRKPGDIAFNGFAAETAGPRSELGNDEWEVVAAEGEEKEEEFQLVEELDCFEEVD